MWYATPRRLINRYEWGFQIYVHILLKVQLLFCSETYFTSHTFYDRQNLTTRRNMVDKFGLSCSVKDRSTPVRRGNARYSKNIVAASESIENYCCNRFRCSQKTYAFADLGEFCLVNWVCKSTKFNRPRNCTFTEIDTNMCVLKWLWVNCSWLPKIHTSIQWSWICIHFGLPASLVHISLRTTLARLSVLLSMTLGWWLPPSFGLNSIIGTPTTYGFNWNALHNTHLIYVGYYTRAVWVRCNLTLRYCAIWPL